MFITQIGTTVPHQLTCITDKMPCCRSAMIGNWHFPNDSVVPNIGYSPIAFHRNRSNNGEINLFRVNNDVISPTGRVCCKVPDAATVHRTLCVNISESYHDQLAIIIIPHSVSVSVQISDHGTPTLGERYSLTCGVNGINDGDITYQWSKRESVLSSESALIFVNLGLRNAGLYICTVTVTTDRAMDHVEKEISIARKDENNYFYNIIMLLCSVMHIVPAPSHLTITSIPISPIRPIGSDVLLTCAVELNPLVDVPVTVNTVWTGPAGFMTTNTAMGSSTTYTSTAMVSSFEREKSGDYTCAATISSMSSFLFSSESQSETTKITVGETVIDISVHT